MGRGSQLPHSSGISSPSVRMPSSPLKVLVAVEQPMQLGYATLTLEEHYCRIQAGECLYGGQPCHFILVWQKGWVHHSGGGTGQESML